MKTITLNLQDPDTWPFVKGTSRSEVSEFLEEVPEIFIKNKEFSEISTDNFVNNGVHAYYDAEDTLEGVELFPSKNIRVEVNEQNILGLLSSEVSDICKNIFELRPYDDGFESVDGRIRFYAPDNLLASVYLVLI